MGLAPKTKMGVCRKKNVGPNPEGAQKLYWDSVRSSLDGSWCTCMWEPFDLDQPRSSGCDLEAHDGLA